MSDAPEDKIRRVVTRKGKRVVVIQYIGAAYMSKPLYYEFPSPAKARAFEKDITRVEGEFPVTISLKWKDYLMGEIEDPEAPESSSPEQA